MFMVGSFMRYRFMDTGRQVGDARMIASQTTSADLVVSTDWDVLLEEDGAPIIYLAVIEPGVLSDRS